MNNSEKEISEEGRRKISLSLIHICVYVKDNKLLYVFVIPLINDLLFELYKVSPLPKYLKNNEYLFIQPKTEYMGIDDVKQYFIYLKSFSAKQPGCVLSAFLLLY